MNTWEVVAVAAVHAGVVLLAYQWGIAHGETRAYRVYRQLRIDHDKLFALSMELLTEDRAAPRDGGGRDGE